MTTLADRLLDELAEIVRLMDELLDTSTINWVPNRMRREADRTGVAILGLSDGIWGPTDDRQKQLQRALLERWNRWLEQVNLLFSGDTNQRKREVEKAARSVQSWIQRDGNHHSIPSTINEAKAVFRKMADPLGAALRSLGTGGHLLVIPDTNVILRSPDISKYGTVLDGASAYSVLLVPGVLAELDEQKMNHRNPKVRERARKVTSRIKGWRNQGDLAHGVKVQGDVYVRVEGREPDFKKTLSWLQSDVTDDRIIASILEVQRRHPTDRVVLLTGDTIMLAKADSANVPTRDTPDPEVEEQP